MTPSNEAIAQAFREALVSSQDGAGIPDSALGNILRRARELDAGKGGDKPHVRVGFVGHVDHGKSTLTAALMHISKMEAQATPPAQAAEAVVERVARAMYAVSLIGDGEDDYTLGWDEGSPGSRDYFTRMARAAIAAMQAGEAGSV